MAKIRIKSAGKIIAWMMRGIGATLRFEIEDRAGAFRGFRPGFIWAFWHNRMFLVPWLHERWVEVPYYTPQLVGLAVVAVIGNFAAVQRLVRIGRALG